ncbi:hypothetical protein Moror_12292, partial [Moniliophthora roreri MCA 2997]
TEPEAKSSEADPLNEDRNIHHTPTPEMTTPGTSNAQDDVPDIVPKIEPETTETTDGADAQWARTISTAVIETINDKKDESSKGPVPESYKGEHSDTRHFLLDLELYFRMNLSRADMDEKKKMLLLSLVKGKRTVEWKMREQMRLFPENDPKEKRKQPIDLKGQAQMKIEEIRMMDRADDYVNKFHLIVMETKYDEQVLMKFFREGLPVSLQDRIMLQTDGAPETLDEWYQTAIKYNNQYKLVIANKKRRSAKEPVKLKVLRKEKEVVIGGILSESDRKDYMAQGKCFCCAKTSHLSQDFPIKGQTPQPVLAQTEPRKLSL